MTKFPGFQHSLAPHKRMYSSHRRIQSS